MRPAMAEVQYDSAWQKGEVAAVRLISASGSFSMLGVASAAQEGADKKIQLAGLEFQLAEGWKTYWHTPGAAGFGAETNWQASENLQTAEIFWPLPKRFSLFGEDFLGYDSGKVILPLLIGGLDGSREVKLKGNIFYLACKQLCIPHQAQVALTLPALDNDTGTTGAADSPHQKSLLQALARVPTTQDHRVRLLTQAIEQDDSTGAKMVVSARLPVPLVAPHILAASQDALFGEAEEIISHENTDGSTSLSFVLPLRTAPGLDPRQLAGRAFSISFADRAAPVGTVAHRGWEINSSFALLQNFNVLPVLLLAFLGGLILNFMPCVLPVLTLKILHLLRLREEAEADTEDGEKFLQQVRQGFVVSSLGIYAAFMSLGIAVAVTVALARTAGWGVQFQSPTFLVVMALALTLFTAWVWGWWRLPLGFGSLGSSVGSSAGSSVGSSPRLGEEANRSKFLSDFSAGFLATLLATPCSAPFLGTAVGFALTLNTADTLLIFFAMATGFAAPWLIFAAVPQGARFLPRPGAWMERLERLLGFGLLLTALWLISLLDGAIAWMAVALLGMLLMLLRQENKRESRRESTGASKGENNREGKKTSQSQALSRGAIASLIVAVLLLPYGLGKGDDGTFAPTPERQDKVARLPAPWQVFSPRAIEVAVTSNKVSLVVFTADWCVTCKVNESLVLRSQAIEQILAGEETVALLGDWTEPDPEIAAWLAHHGRYGIPFTAVYGPGALDGILLPELLTKSSLLQALAQASGS